MRHLTPREKQVARMLRDGKEPKKIAEILGIAPWTAIDMARRIYKVFDVSGQTELMAALLLPLNSPLRRVR